MYRSPKALRERLGIAISKCAAETIGLRRTALLGRTLTFGSVRPDASQVALVETHRPQPNITRL